MRFTRLLLSLIALSFAACDDVPAVAPAETTGTIVHRWTIEGAQTPEACARHGADQMRLILYDGPGNVYGSAFAPCNAFTLRQIVPARSYTAVVTLLDVNAAPVSETLEIGSLVVEEGRETGTSNDFPTVAFGPL